jgi:hypothetical protein
MPSFITAHLWKIATGGAAVFALVLGVFLLSSYSENRGLSQQRDAFAEKINNPKTGYIAQLAQARTNVEQLKTVVETQNAAIDRLSAEGAARLAASERRLAAAQAETRVLERKVAVFMSTKPQGVTLDERVRDVDSRAMKEFLP